MSETGELAFFEALETHRACFCARDAALAKRPAVRGLPGPFGGPVGRLMSRLGFGPSRKNLRLCSTCFEHAPMGGVEMEVGILFADIRGFTTLAEHESPDSVATLLNHFHTAAIDVLAKHAIIDKLVGDQVMALYLPRVFAGELTGHMVDNAHALLDAAGYTRQRPWVALGIGLDFGTAYVKIVMSDRVHARARAFAADAVPRSCP
jgi:adenylate cyclase